MIFQTSMIMFHVNLQGVVFHFNSIQPLISIPKNLMKPQIWITFPSFLFGFFEGWDLKDSNTTEKSRVGLRYFDVMNHEVLKKNPIPFLQLDLSGSSFLQRPPTHTLSNSFTFPWSILSRKDIGWSKKVAFSTNPSNIISSKHLPQNNLI